jgi:monoamine oxidase
MRIIKNLNKKTTVDLIKHYKVERNNFINSTDKHINAEWKEYLLKVRDLIDNRENKKTNIILETM